MPKGFSENIRKLVNSIKKTPKPVLVEGEGHNLLPWVFGIDEHYKGKYIGNGYNYFINGKVPGLTDSAKNTTLADAIFETAVKGMIPAIQGTNAYIAGMMVKSFLANTLFYSKSFERTKDGKIPFVLNVRDDAVIGKIATITSGHKEIIVKSYENGALTISAENNDIIPNKGRVDNAFDYMLTGEKGSLNYYSALSILPKTDGGFVSAQYDVNLERQWYKDCIINGMGFNGSAELISVSKDGYVSQIPAGQYDASFQVSLENGRPFVSILELDDNGRAEYERKLESAKEEGTPYGYEREIGLVCEIALAKSALTNKSDELFEDAERYALTGKLAKEDDASQIEEQTDGMEQ